MKEQETSKAIATTEVKIEGGCFIWTDINGWAAWLSYIQTYLTPEDGDYILALVPAKEWERQHPEVEIKVRWL